MTDPSGSLDRRAPNGPLARIDETLPARRVDEVRLNSRLDADDDDTIDLREYWSILVRRRWTVLGVLIAVVVVTILATFLTTPIYRGTLLLQIDREEGKVLEYQTVAPEDARNANDFYQTQYELLQSRSLARRVIDQLGLKGGEEDDGGFFSDLTRAVKGGIAGLVGRGEGAQSADAGAAAANEENAFLANLTIEPVRNSRLVRVHYESPNPVEAAAVANAVADNYINTNLERRFDASAYAKSFLEERLQQVRANLEDSEQRLIAYARDREIVDLDDRLSVLLQQLRELNTELTKAQAERIAAEAEYNEMVAGGVVANSAKVLGSPVIASLKERKADLEGQYQDGLKVFKPGYPSMQQLQRQIADVDQAIRQEANAIAESIKALYQAKIRQEATLMLRLQEVKEEVLALQDRSTDYQTLKREVETNRELYDGLLQRMKEIGVVAGIGTNNVSIVDRAQVPPSPYKPSLAKNLALAIALGLFGGVGLAFLFETLDDTIKTGDDVERRLGAPVLGVFPLADEVEEDGAIGSVALRAARDPKSHLAESARSLRTSLVFATSDGAPRLIHFTSAGPGEGKTTAAASTAIAFAQAGSKVLVIDCDLRNPSVHEVFTLGNSRGLTHYLAGDVKPADIAQPTAVPRLFAITSGPMPPNPVELLSGPKMLDLLRLATERFDHVVLDSPPVIGLADALVLANLARATVFVVHPGGTRKGAFEGAVKRLDAANARIIGAVLQKVGRSSSGYGYGYGYDYAYHYSYGGDAEKIAGVPATSQSAG
ncbi:GumC family protein [Thiococcus pfennigii]|uniref:GumC family protein n=1 Tax=Thiococcus pfennigii TaxID=1057 RepID=UPI001904C5EC|nr:polysaccharide biosynthesis tyrosine autokinase [Thiococcus pfennigii]MBK1732445.1 hypothetical protein [Thiococcus pfennigii]